jgi:hypothetical protein
MTSQPNMCVATSARNQMAGALGRTIRGMLDRFVVENGHA